MRDTYICINNKESSLQYFLFIYKINAFSLSICVAVFLCHLVGWREWENLYIQTPRLMIIKIKRVYWVIRFCCCFLTWIGRRVAKAANGIKPTTSEFLFYWLELISKFYFLFFCVEQMRLSKMQTDARNGLDRLLIYFLWKTSHRILVIDRFIMCHSNLIKVNKKFFFVWFRIWF
jgi:hypothetical protein